MSLIEQIKEDLLDALNVSEYKDTDAPSSEDRREAKYTVGESLLKARKQFASNNEYGDWVAALLKNVATKPHRESISRYRQLAEFGSFSDCEKVGFTNVYKLMQEDNKHLIQQAKTAENKKEISNLLAPKVEEKIKEVSDCINDFINALEDIAEDWCDSPGELLFNALIGGNDKKHFKAAMSKYHTDKGGDSRLFNVVMALKNAQ
tara:strand:- start:124 stop:738 length:615 start_codon:yes stop_codon:yes gene_type:complete